MGYNGTPSYSFGSSVLLADRYFAILVDRYGVDLLDENGDWTHFVDGVVTFDGYGGIALKGEGTETCFPPAMHVRYGYSARTLFGTWLGNRSTAAQRNRELNSSKELAAPPAIIHLNTTYSSLVLDEV